MDDKTKKIVLARQSADRFRAIPWRRGILLTAPVIHSDKSPTVRRGISIFCF